MAMPRVAVVGGSIGGLTAALLLRDAGCEVDVYERAGGTLSGYGAGIVVQPELVRYFLERTGITLDRISVASSGVQYFNAATGAALGRIDEPWRFTSYNALYGGLLQCFGTDRYHFGHTLRAVDQNGDGVALRFNNCADVQCELAVCADGGASTARRLLLGIEPRYAGYVSWRGRAPQESLSASAWAFFSDRFTYSLLPDSHLIAYPIPIVDDDLQVRGRHINYQWYWNIPEGAALDDILTDRDGVRRPVTVHANDLPPRHLAELHRRARVEIALAPLAELVTRTEGPYVTIIADADVPQMAIGRVCLIGDAAVTGRPHAAAGGAKAAANAWALTQALVDAGGDVPSALRHWEPAQLRQGRALLDKVRRMGAVLQHGGSFVPGDPENRWGLPAAA